MLRHLIPVVAIILAGLVILFWWTPPCRLSPSDTAALERQLQGYDLLIAKASPEEKGWPDQPEAGSGPHWTH